MILLSLIIPCYNNENFIYECLQSVFSQSDETVEVVIVNDGSIDNSDEEIRHCINEYKPLNVIYFTQKNMGPSGARNAALKKASGKYTGFLDGDDLWDSNAWKILKPILHSLKYDIIEVDGLTFDDGKSHKEGKALKVTSFNKEHLILKPIDLLPVFLSSKWYACFRIFRSQLISEIYFAHGRRYEDTMFTPYAYFKANRIYSLNDIPIYYYRINQYGITRNPTLSDIEDILYSMHQMNDYALQSNNDEIKLLAAKTIENMLRSIKRFYREIHGSYCFEKEIIDEIRSATRNSIKYFKLSNKIKFKHIEIYSLLSKWKNRTKKTPFNIS